MTSKEDNKREVGSLLQAYARAKRKSEPDYIEDLVRLSGMLGRELMRRVDGLGFDADRLLNVPPEDALEMLDTLEREALLEDANAGAKDAPATDAPPSWHNGRSVLGSGAGRRRHRS